MHYPVREGTLTGGVDCFSELGLDRTQQIVTLLVQCAQASENVNADVMSTQNEKGHAPNTSGVDYHELLTNEPFPNNAVKKVLKKAK
jgi:hypothetical protein